MKARLRSTRPLGTTLAAALAALALAAPAARAEDNPSNQSPFGGEPLPKLVEPGSQHALPAGFEVSAAQAIAIAADNDVVRAELDESPEATPTAFIRGDRWQVNYALDGGLVAQVVIDGTSGSVDEAWRDFQVETPLARGYDGAIAQTVNSPWVWLPLCLLFVAPFFDPRRPARLLHLDLLVLLGLGISLFFFNRAEITASVALTYPVLGYFLVRMLVAGLWPREREGPVVPVVADPLARDRRRRPRRRADRAQHRRLACDRHRGRRRDRRRSDHGWPAALPGRFLPRPRPQGRRVRTGELPVLRPVRARVRLGWGLGRGRRRRARGRDHVRPRLRRGPGCARAPSARRRGGAGARLGARVRLGGVPVDPLRDERERQRCPDRRARVSARCSRCARPRRGLRSPRSPPRRSSARPPWRRCSPPPTRSAAGAGRCGSRLRSSPSRRS